MIFFSATIPFQSRKCKNLRYQSLTEIIIFEVNVGFVRLCTCVHHNIALYKNENRSLYSQLCSFILNMKNYYEETLRVAEIVQSIGTISPPPNHNPTRRLNFEERYYDILKNVVETVDNGKFAILQRESANTQEC